MTPFRMCHSQRSQSTLVFRNSQAYGLTVDTKKFSGGGVRGIIVYRTNSTSYNAFERNCSYHPNDACATVNVHNSGLYMTDPCCASTFDFLDGNPSGGIAWRPLRRYRTQLNGLTLSITDEDPRAHIEGRGELTEIGRASCRERV